MLDLTASLETMCGINYKTLFYKIDSIMWNVNIVIYLISFRLFQKGLFTKYTGNFLDAFHFDYYCADNVLNISFYMIRELSLIIIILSNCKKENLTYFQILQYNLKISFKTNIHVTRVFI